MNGAYRCDFFCAITLFVFAFNTSIESPLSIVLRWIFHLSVVRIDHCVKALATSTLKFHHIPNTHFPLISKLRRTIATISLSLSSPSLSLSLSPPLPIAHTSCCEYSAFNWIFNRDRRNISHKNVSQFSFQSFTNFSFFSLLSEVARRKKRCKQCVRIPLHFLPACLYEKKWYFSSREIRTEKNKKKSETASRSANSIGKCAHFVCDCSPRLRSN